MKRITNKLTLTRETVKHLGLQDLARATGAGGQSATGMPNCFSCNPTDVCPPSDRVCGGGGGGGLTALACTNDVTCLTTF